MNDEDDAQVKRKEEETSDVKGTKSEQVNNKE